MLAPGLRSDIGNYWVNCEASEAFEWLESGEDPEDVGKHSECVASAHGPSRYIAPPLHE
jgi:hypothetical protein